MRRWLVRIIYRRDPQVEQSLRNLEAGQGVLIGKVEHLQATVNALLVEPSPQLRWTVGPISEQE